jgi:hypothetical protein
MRIPQQVSERVKEAPAQALRAVFSGIGQVLLVADRIKSRAAEPDPAPSSPAEPAPQATATMVRDETKWRSLDKTGNVRLIPGQDTSRAAAAPPAPEASEVITEVAEVTEVAEATDVDEVTEVAEVTAVTEVAEVIEPGETAETASTVAPEPVAVAEQTAAEQPAAEETAATSLPVPNYDSLTVPSLRARLRNLDTAQLRTLLDYEKAHASRGDVLTMFERRIAKLESDGA